MAGGRGACVMASFAEQRLAALRRALNGATGYDRIEVLLRQVSETQEGLSRATAASKDAKRGYEEAVERRGALQNELIMLLQRKSSWAPADTAMFAGLVQRELEATANESVAKKEFQDAEQRAQDALDAMTQTALMRYNEEQLWSDKMRALSTYVSAGLVGINTLLLMVSVLVIEPYKRSRLTEQVVQRLEKELNASGGAVELLRQTHDRVTLLTQPCSLSREKEEEVQQDIGARTGREDSGIRLADGSSASVEADKEGRRFVEARDLLTVEGWKALLSMVRDSSQREKSYAVAGAFIGGAAAALLVGFMNR